MALNADFSFSEQDPQTPTGRKRKTPTVMTPQSSASTANAEIVAQKMRWHMLFRDESIYKTYAAFKDHVEKVKRVERPSAVKPGSAREYQEKIEYYRAHNEDTWLDQLLPMIIKRDHQTKSLTHATWWSEGLVTTTNREFARALLHTGYEDMGLKPETVRELSKGDGMTCPKPDRAYGVRMTFLDKPHEMTLTAETADLIHIAPGMVAPFFLIEGKSHRGTTLEAENQACQGGATLVLALRRLYDLAGIPDEPPGPDTRTFVYTATIEPKYIEIWVHWAEVSADPDQRVKFHMNNVFGKLSRDDDALELTRRVIHNIFEWGLNVRFEALKEMFKKVWEGEPGRLKELEERMEREKYV